MNELPASEERFMALVTATSDVVYRLSPDWEVMYELDGRGFLKVLLHQVLIGEIKMYILKI